MAGFSNSFSTLTAYVNQHAITEFMTPAIIPNTLDSTLGSGIEVLDNVKYKTAIPKLSITTKVQLQTCNPTASGDTVISQVIGEVCPLMIKDKFCFIGTTNQYFFNEFMKAGSDYQNNEWFNKTFIPELNKKTKEQVQNIFWKGDTDNGVGSLGQCDGISYIISGSTSNTTISGGTVVTAANVIGLIEAMYAAYSDVVKFTESTFYVSPSVAALLPGAYKAAYGYDAWLNLQPGAPVPVPGKPNIKFNIQTGLVGTDRIILTPDNNLVYLNDLRGEEDRVMIAPNPFTFEIEYAVLWKQGAVIKDEQYVVSNF